MTESETVWSAQDTTPSAIEEALRDLLKQRYEAGEACAPARVLNLIVVADREWRGEIQNRLDNVGRYHASRTILCDVEQGRSEIDAVATVSADGEAVAAGLLAVAREEVVVDVGPEHLPHLDRIVDPLLVTDLATLVWSPHGHDDAVDALLRSTPWRERVASTFDPPQWRPELERISAVTVRFQPDSAVSGVLLLGWLARRLGWDPGPLGKPDGDGRLRGAAQADHGEVTLTLDPDETMPIPGLAGLTIETSSGLAISLDRGPGGLAAWRRTPDGHESRWTVTGASRGEAGILGEGIRQALLRDKGYAQALSAAEAMVCP